jgi:hypothetical protein
MYNGEDRKGKILNISTYRLNKLHIVAIAVAAAMLIAVAAVGVSATKAQFTRSSWSSPIARSSWS